MCDIKKLCSNNECKVCFEKSFATCEKSKYWSIKNNLAPRQIFKSSNKKYIFDCNICNHEFSISLGSISNMNSWCSYCGNKKLCGNSECKVCFEKSFASCEKSKYWSIKNNLTPRQIFKSSNKKYIFDCNICNHEFSITLNNINREKNRWCNYCKIPSKKLCNNTECKICFEKSFASHKKSKYWSIKNILTPRQIFKYSNKNYIFNCNLCNNEFNSILSSITNMNSWCSCIKNKTENKFYKEIIKYYPNIIKQYRQEWCKNKKKLPFDFCIEQNKIIIELDGNQHFKQIMNWKSPKDNNITDLYKQKCANNNGYSIIRLLQNDVWFDKNNWIEILLESIKKIIIDNKVQNIYLCNSIEYNNLK